jgi:hypothetical protein
MPLPFPPDDNHDSQPASSNDSETKEFTLGACLRRLRETYDAVWSLPDLAKTESDGSSERSYSRLGWFDDWIPLRLEVRFRRLMSQRGWKFIPPIRFDSILDELIESVPEGNTKVQLRALKASRAVWHADPKLSRRRIRVRTACQMIGILWKPVLISVANVLFWLLFRYLWLLVIVKAGKRRRHRTVVRADSRVEPASRGLAGSMAVA